MWKGSTCSKKLLKIIHIDIYGLLKPILCGNKWFITFIDNFSHFGYIYPIYDKLMPLKNFKIFKIEVKTNVGKALKL